MNFYERFEILCNSKGLKPQSREIIKMSGVTSAAITAWKKGFIPKAEVLVRIAEFFDVSTDYLLGLTPKEHHQPITNNHGVTTVTANGSERKLTELELELLNIFEKLNVLEQAKLLVYASELAGNK